MPVRWSSLDPGFINADRLRSLKAAENFLPSFHLSLQSCCDKILAAMNRPYRVEDIFDAFRILRSTWENPVITGDIIVGFPGEEEADFEETFQNLQKLKPKGLHVFSYSKRPQTPAAEVKPQVKDIIKKERTKIDITEIMS